MLTLSACDSADVQLMIATPKRLWEIFTDPHPERLRSLRPKRDTGPVRSPLVENEGKLFRIDGHELTLPNLASSWVEVLGQPAPLPLPKPGHREPPPERPLCLLIWHAQGLTAFGFWATPTGSSLKDCTIVSVDVYLDVDENVLMHPIDDEVRERRPKQNFPGTLIVEGVRIDRGALWHEVRAGWRDKDLACPNLTDWLDGPMSEILCEHKTRPPGGGVYIAHLVRPREAKARTIWSYSFEIAAPE